MKLNDLDEHLAWILDWWSDFVDWDNGGIFTYPHPLKKEIDSPGKALLMHLRQMYNYSVGAEADVPNSAKIAHHLYSTFEDLFPERESGLIVEPPSRGVPEKCCSGYNNAYAVICFSRYARAFEHRKAAEQALVFYQSLARACTDHPLKEKGSWHYWHPGEQRGTQKTDNAVIHRFEAALNLLRALQETAPDLAKANHAYLRREMEDMIAFFQKNICRAAEGFTIEVLEDDGSPSIYTHIFPQSLAHGFEWLGFLFEAEQLLDISIPFLEAEGRLLGRRTMDNGLQPSGCFCNDWMPGMKKAPLKADFWPQVEAILGSLWCRQRWGNSDFPREEADRMWNFYRQNQFKSEELGGGILFSVSENGAPFTLRTGSGVKCDHHSVRLCEKVKEYSLLDPGDSA